MDRKVKETIYNEIHDKGEISQDYVVELLKIYDEAPNTNKLVESHYKSKANRIISSFKDDNHVRDCYAVKEDKKTIYVNIATTNKVYYVKDVKTSLKKQIDGRRKSMQKADNRVKILEGQIGIETIDDNMKLAK